MRHIYLLLAIVALVVATSAAFAGVISEDVAYWCTDGNGTMTIFNPNTDQLNALIGAGRVLVKVQQTVYDRDWSHAMLVRNGDGDNYFGYLYAYSVTNINLGDPSDFSDMGIKDFAATWSSPATYVTTSTQTPTGWVVASNTPQWHWSNANVPGILPGQTVGGFWALSDVGVDGVVNAIVVHDLGESGVVVPGKTTGPVPDPASLTSLMYGIGALGLFVRRRGK